MSEWYELTNRQSLQDMPSLNNLDASLPNVGDYIGQTAHFQQNLLVNDLTANIGCLVSFHFSVSPANRGKWVLADTSSSSVNSRGLLGIVTSDTTAAAPKILLNGLIKMNGDFVNEGTTTLTELDDEHGFPIYGNPNYNGHYTTEPNSTFATGNLVRQLGYVVDFDAGTASGTEEFYMLFRPDNFFMSL